MIDIGRLRMRNSERDHSVGKCKQNQLNQQVQEKNSLSIEHLEYLKKLKFEKNLVLFTQILIFTSFFALWELAARMKWIDPFIFSQPVRIVRTIGEMSADGSLFLHMGVTLGETVVGFMVSTIAGTAIAVILWWNEFCKKALNPYLVVLNSIPKTALAPIIIVWIGNNKNSVIATAIMTSIIVTIMSVLSGFMEVSKDKLKLIRTFGGTKKQELLKVVLPASIPTIINALKINIGLSFVGVIVGEFLVAQSGLGYLIVYGSQIFICVYIQISIVTFLNNIKDNFIKKIKINFHAIYKYNNFIYMLC